MSSIQLKIKKKHKLQEISSTKTQNLLKKRDKKIGHKHNYNITTRTLDCQSFHISGRSHKHKVDGLICKKKFKTGEFVNVEGKIKVINKQKMKKKS